MVGTFGPKTKNGSSRPCVHQITSYPHNSCQYSRDKSLERWRRMDSAMQWQFSEHYGAPQGGTSASSFLHSRPLLPWEPSFSFQYFLLWSSTPLLLYVFGSPMNSLFLFLHYSSLLRFQLELVFLHQSHVVDCMNLESSATLFWLAALLRTV